MFGGAAALVVLILLIVALIVRRSRATATRRLSDAIAELNGRMEIVVSELTGALEQADAEAERVRELAELAAVLELDEVLERTVDAAARIDGADAALVLLPDAGAAKPLIATLGLSSDEAARHGVVAGPPDGRRVRAVEMSYRYGGDDDATGGALIRTGIAVPLPADGATVGHLAIFTRSTERRFGEDALRRLEEIAERAGPALENARRFRDARELADLDALTGLHNQRYFHEALAREVARAQRYERDLALVVFDLDDFKAVNDRIGHLAGDAVLADVAERIRAVVRSADIACRVGGDEFAVILPEATLDDAEQLARRVRHGVSSRAFGNAGRLQLSSGIAEASPEDDSNSFFQRADLALYRSKELGRGGIAHAGE